MPLEKELAFFEKIKPELLKSHQGKFALIKDEELCGTYDTATNAYDEGVKRFGKEPFLVKPISANDEVFRNFALSLGLMNARF